MTPENFVYWLQGYLELSDPNAYLTLDARQVVVIRQHLALVLDKVTEEDPLAQFPTIADVKPSPGPGMRGKALLQVTC